MGSEPPHQPLSARAGCVALWVHHAQRLLCHVHQPLEVARSLPRSLLLPWAEKWNGASDPRGENRRRGESKARGKEGEARPSRRIHGIYTPTSRRKVQLVTRRARTNGSTIVGPQLHVQRADLACLCFTSSSFEIPGACGAACESAQPCRLCH